MTGAGLHLAAFWYQAQPRPADSPTLEPLRPATSSVGASDLAPVPTRRPGASITLPSPASATPRRARTNRPPALPPPPPVRIEEAYRQAPASPSRRLEQRPAPRPSAPGKETPPVPSPERDPVAAPPPGVTIPPGEAVVALRNETSGVLDFSFETAGIAGVVAPYSRIAVPLPPGDYDLSLRTPAHKRTLFAFRVERGRRYSVAFDGRDARVDRE